MEGGMADFLAEIAEYYSAKLVQFGDSPRGVDWNDEEGQILRFRQLERIIGSRSAFSINDLGCGYGAFVDFLNARYFGYAYHGCDISPDMIRKAEARNAGRSGTSFSVSAEPTNLADYGIASGIFNVKLGRSDADWHAHVETTLHVLDQTSRLGFAFNCLTSYSDEEKRRAHLYYANPSVIFDLCKRRFSRNVALLHDYGLYEFTILVRK